jgi:hypothetical protein
MRYIKRKRWPVIGENKERNEMRAGKITGGRGIFFFFLMKQREGNTRKFDRVRQARVNFKRKNLTVAALLDENEESWVSC